ncbi:hypothetical protein QCA50_010433 [Cerrena zonata]|uniref:Uncharacterized protein n=1 Tax=Cerrena zonata TaxID=2478898 RepID=A0AAW0FXI5_9APHY
MHHCLQIYEILEMISGELYDEAEVWQNPEAEDAIKRPIMPHNPLLAWALTCRTFTEPALDILWRSLQSPYPIGFAFQPNVQPVLCGSNDGADNEDEDTNSEADEYDYILLGFSTTPSPAAWDRFRSYYGRQVRAIEFWDCPLWKCMVSPRFLAELTAYRPPGDLFPNLREARWFEHRKELFPHITLFLTTTLTSITISFKSNTNVIRFCDLIRVFAPALKHVVIEYYSFRPTPAMQVALTRTLSS